MDSVFERPVKVQSMGGYTGIKDDDVEKSVTMARAFLLQEMLT